MAAPQRRWAAELLHAWFHILGPRVWFAPDPRADAMLRRRFERELLALRRRPAEEFLTDPKSALAAVLLFDQLPRNLYRKSPLAFASDPLARAIARGALDRGWDAALTLRQRQFLAMPLMHSEAIADQRRSLAVYARLARWSAIRSLCISGIARNWRCGKLRAASQPRRSASRAMARASGSNA